MSSFLLSVSSAYTKKALLLLCLSDLRGLQTLLKKLLIHRVYLHIIGSILSGIVGLFNLVDAGNFLSL